MGMTRDEAVDLMERIGCIDTRNVACLHISYANYIDRVGRGLCQPLPVAEAYAILSKKEPPAEQAVLFDKAPSAL